MATSSNLSQTLSFEKRNNFRDPSFSAYLSSSEENFAVKLTESTQKASPPTMSPLGQSHNQNQGQVYGVRVKDTEDEEIDVFGAERYFQGEVEEEEESTRKVISKGFSTLHLHQNELSQLKSTQSSPASVNMCSENQKKQLGSRSVCSESSVNSRSVLLRKVPRNRASSKGSYVKNFFASLGCNCKDVASIEVDEQSVVEKGAYVKETTKPPLITTGDFVQEAKSMPWAEEKIHINLKKEDCFSFPVLSIQEGEKDKNHLNTEKKLSMLNNWDAIIPRKEEIEKLSYDAASDASSDLFELESFSTNGMSSCMTPITCYAPSEASIEWSVVTASAADCYEGINGKPNNFDRMVRNTKIGKMGRDRVKRGKGILLGCTSVKAVNIVENEYRSTTGEKVSGRNPVITPVTRFRGESKLTGCDSGRGHRGYSNCSLPQSHSPRLLYIQ